MSNETSQNPWFGLSMGLIGVIVGYGFAMSTVSGMPSDVAPAPTAQVVADPTPSAPPPPATADDLKPVDPEMDYIRGDANAPISIVEYSDYECPFCARHHPTVQALIDNNEDVNWVYRHFPLSFHPNAQVTAEASECVGELGGNDAFWEFSDIVFEQGAVEAKLADYAVEVGVDADAFQNCLDSGKYTDKVDTDMSEGSLAGVTGTPGNIVVNNETGETRLVSGAQPLSALQAAVDALR